MSFSKQLINWYSENKRDLPWRKTSNPYYIWLSEIILQQTQVKQGLPYYEKFIDVFPSIKELANASENDVLHLWQGLGYYSRARNLHSAAKYVVNNLNEEFPKTYNELIKLKGVGDYTASAIASFANNEATAVVDGNVYRVLSRYFGVKTPINSTEGIKEFKVLATEQINNENPGEHNQAIMEFGALQCKPKNPYCHICPLQNTCVAFNTNMVTELPVKIKKQKISKKYYNYIIYIDKSGNTIIEQRINKGIWQNLYQFPLIESEKSIDLADLKKLNLLFPNKEISKISLYNKKEIVHKLSHQHLYTKFWIVNLKSNKLEFYKWEDLNEFPFPVLISNFIENFSNPTKE